MIIRHHTSPSKDFLRLLIPALVCAGFAAAGALLLNQTMLYSPDSVNYLAWARSLSILHGFRIDLSPEPAHYVANAPLYPLLLAPAAFLFPWSIIAAKITTLAFGVLLVAAAYTFFGKRLSPSSAIAATILLAFNPLTLVFSTQILSDVPFLACVVLGFMACEAVLKANRVSPMTMVLLAVLTCASVLLREVGIAFAAAVTIALFVRKKTIPLLWLILALIITYGTWYIRNEIIVAGAEQPDLRNTRLFFAHILTPSEGSLTGEFFARLVAALHFYGPTLGKLVFAPVSLIFGYCLDTSPDPMLSAAHSVLDRLGLSLQLLSLVLVLWGGYVALRRSVLRILSAAFIVVYAGLIAFYPINDIRFVFPLLFIMLWWVWAGAEDLFARIPQRIQMPSRVFLGAAIIAFLLPFGLWLKNVASLNAFYRADPEACRTMLRTNDPSPNQLLLDPRPAVEWITQHSPPSVSIISAYKEAGIWLQGRPVIRLNQLIAPEDFENYVRDYDVAYVMTSLIGHEIPDFEAQMVLGKRFRYTEVYTTGDVAVFAVAPREQAGEPTFVLSRKTEGEHHIRFLRGLLSLDAGAPDAAITMFESLAHIPAFEAYATFYLAISQESAQHLERAEELLHTFRSMPQAAAYLIQARSHEDIIGLLREVEKSTLPEDQALLYHTISLSYWILGLHHQALEMMDRSLAANPGLFIGYLFRGLYELSEGDTSSAKTSLKEAIHTRPDDPLSPPLEHLCNLLDSLKNGTERSRIELALGREFVAMGLIEMGIDQAKKALRYDTGNVDALKLLADLYEKKGRPVPELRALRKLRELRPLDPLLKEKFQLLSREETRS